MFITFRLRHELDTFPFLRSRKEVPCVIIGDEEDEDIHFILHYKQVNVLAKATYVQNRPVYIKFGNNEVRTVVSEIRMAPGNLYLYTPFAH